MYYLYHIPGKKIGVTTNLLKRVTKTQGYKSGEYEILLSSDDIDFISDQERELQKKFGYKVDITPYNKLLKTKKEMKINITEQTTTFPCPRVHLADALIENDGMTWETILGEFKNTEETISEINEYIGLGFNYIKIKLGNDVNEDIRRVNIINEKFGDKIKIRIDANQGWSLGDTIKFYDETNHIELIEQPLSVEDLSNYLQFPSKIKDVIALDESLVNFKDAIKLSSENYGKIFKIWKINNRKRK